MPPTASDTAATRYAKAETALAIVSRDGLTRIFQTRTGEELLALGSPGGVPLAVALLPDRLIVSDSLAAVTVYDAASRPADTSLWHTTQAARAIIDPLFESLFHSQRVIDHLSAHPHPDPALNALATELARGRGDSLNQINSLAWGIVRFPSPSADALARAIDDAELCCRAKPDNWAYANTLGVAYFRAARYTDAITLLLKSEQLARAGGRAPEPLNTLFIAISHHELGETLDARNWWNTTLALRPDIQATNDVELRSAIEEARRVFGD